MKNYLNFNLFTIFMNCDRPSERLAVSTKTKQLIDECILEFKKNNPDFNNVNITQNFIVERICLYYLNRL